MFRNSPWLDRYPKDVPGEVLLGGETLVSVFEKSAYKFQKHTAIEFLGTCISYGELGEFVERFAETLLACGVKRGDRVALCLPNCPEAVIAYFGILRVCGIVVACNPLYTEYELRHQLEDAKVVVLVVLDSVYEKVKNVSARHHIIVRITEFLSLIKKIGARIKLGKAPRIEKNSNTLFFMDCIGRTARSRGSFPAAYGEDCALLQYTGGTTGSVKGAMLTHRNLVANVRQLIAWFKRVQDGEERFAAILPLFHIFGMTVTQNMCLALGGTMILVPDPRNQKFLRYAIIQKKATVITLVPRLYQLLTKILSSNDLSSIKYCVSGGAGLPPVLFEEFFQKFGKKIVEGYGLSEASPVTHCNDPESPIKGVIGVPIPNTIASIRDDDGNECPQNIVGELCVRGPQIMKGYWQNNEETAAIFTVDGWLKTGDMARMGDDGLFYIVDRKKDMILSDAGFNVYPSEVEAALKQHPAIQDAAVISVPIEGRERIKAFVVSKDGVQAVTERELIAFTKNFLAHYKIPRVIEFRSEIPYSVIGKPLRRVLREEEIQKIKSVKSAE